MSSLRQLLYWPVTPQKVAYVWTLFFFFWLRDGKCRQRKDEEEVLLFLHCVSTKCISDKRNLYLEKEVTSYWLIFTYRPIYLHVVFCVGGWKTVNWFEEALQQLEGGEAWEQSYILSILCLQCTQLDQTLHSSLYAWWICHGTNRLCS